MWNWLNAPHKPQIERFAIVDSGGLFYCDRDYKEKGVEEGWLTYNGYNRDEHNNLVYLYRFRE